GSTGTPKGVVVTHASLRNYTAWAVEHYQVELGSGAAPLTPLAFDATVTSLFLPLLCGKRAVLLPQDQQLELLASDHAAGDFSLLKLTPAHIDILNQLAPLDSLKGMTHRL